MNNLDNLLDHARIRQRTSIAKLVLLARQDLAQDTAHDLAAPRLGKVGHNVHGLGRREGSDALAHLDDELLPERVRGVVAVFYRDESVDGLAGQLVGYTDDGGLRDGVVLDQSRFDLGCGQAVAADVDDVVDAAADPVESFVVTAGTVSGEVVALVRSGKCPCSACGRPRLCGPC